MAHGQKNKFVINVEQKNTKHIIEPYFTNLQSHKSPILSLLNLHDLRIYLMRLGGQTIA